jgi:hypothetical protein
MNECIRLIIDLITQELKILHYRFQGNHKTNSLFNHALQGVFYRLISSPGHIITINPAPTNDVYGPGFTGPLLSFKPGRRGPLSLSPIRRGWAGWEDRPSELGGILSPSQAVGSAGTPQHK